MNKLQFMHWCWGRSFKYGEARRIAEQLSLDPNEIPSRDEYEDFYKEADDSYYNTLK